MAAQDIALMHKSRRKEAPWIGVGTEGMWDDVGEAMRDSGIAFEVESKDMIIEDSSPHPLRSHWVGSGRKKVPGVMANVRKDTGDIVGVVSDRYGIVQNKDAFSLLNPFLRMGGMITHAGMTEQGMCFMVMDMRGIRLLNGDEFELYVCAMNSFNSKYPLAIMFTPMRVVCQNMFPKLLKDKTSSVRIKHGSNSSQRLLFSGGLQDQMNMFMSNFKDKMEEFYTARVDVSHYVNKMFRLPTDDSAPNYERSKEKVFFMRELFQEEYVESFDNYMYHGTAMSFVNAYYDYMSHRPEPRSMSGSWSDRRLTGLMSGKDVDFKLLNSTIN